MYIRFTLFLTCHPPIQRFTSTRCTVFHLNCCCCWREDWGWIKKREKEEKKRKKRDTKRAMRVLPRLAHISGRPSELVVIVSLSSALFHSSIRFTKNLWNQIRKLLLDADLICPFESLVLVFQSAASSRMVCETSNNRVMVNVLTKKKMMVKC